MARILVNYPTRQRFSKFIQIMSSYRKKASGNHDIKYFIKIDENDVSMNNDRIKKYISLIPKSELLIMDSPKGKIDAINRGVYDQMKNFDCLVNIADDLDVLEENWDETIVKDFDNNYDQCLNYNCDPRLEDFKSLIILPIIGYKLFYQFGYIYHPSYKSEWCDNEQTEVFSQLGKLKHIDRKLFHHDWWGNQDELMKKNMQIGLTDKENYISRKGNNFDL